MKKLINVFFIAMMNLFVVFAQDSVAIEKDCELLKTYLQDVSIDCSLAVDEGLVDLDDVIQKIKDDYNSRKKKSKANNKGIYQEEFAKSIHNVLSKELPYKNGHMSIQVLDYHENVFPKQFVFFAGIYFEKRDSDFFVVESDVKSVKKGMKYTGDVENLFQTVFNGEVLYQFGIFSPYMKKKAEISIENKTKKVPITWTSNYAKSDELEYEITDDVFTIRISTFMPKDPYVYEKKIREIQKELEVTDKTVVFDLRGNSGGMLNYTTSFLYSLFMERTEENAALFSQIVDAIVANTTDINTETLRQLLILNNLQSHYRNLLTNPNRYIFHESETSEVAIENPKYKKNLYVLVSSYSASSAEYFANYAKCMYDNTIIVGDNTSGCADFGTSITCTLTDSKVSILLCATDGRNTTCLANNESWKGDCYGIFPDYWAVGDNVQKTLDFLIHK